MHADKHIAPPLAVHHARGEGVGAGQFGVNLALSRILRRAPNLVANMAHRAACFPAPNLTPDATGLLGWTDAEIKSAMLDGVTDYGEPLFPVIATLSPSRMRRVTPRSASKRHWRRI